jgi:hypothetical protein
MFPTMCRSGKNVYEQRRLKEGGEEKETCVSDGVLWCFVHMLQRDTHTVVNTRSDQLVHMMRMLYYKQEQEFSYIVHATSLYRTHAYARCTPL